jgi:hypothetical protein
MTDVIEFFEKLYRLMQQEQLWGPLAVVLPTIGVVSFLAGRHFPKYPIVVTSRNPDTQPVRDARINELECEIKDLRHEITLARSETKDLRDQLDTTHTQNTELGAQLAVAQAENEGLCGLLATAQATIKDLGEKLATLGQRLDNARRSVSPSGPGIWMATEPDRSNNYTSGLKNSIPVYVVANLKGGVGKTTIATGLAAHFANPFGDPGRKSERVLLIDLDFQGSLSSMALTTVDRIPDRDDISRASRLISGGANASTLMHMRQRVKGLEGLPRGRVGEFHAIPAYYDIAQAENRLMVEWLIGGQQVRHTISFG